MVPAQNFIFKRSAGSSQPVVPQFLRSRSAALMDCVVRNGCCEYVRTICTNAVNCLVGALLSFGCGSGGAQLT